MGNVEKWVVLGVLALIVGILVVSLNVDDPLRKDKVVLAGDVAAAVASDMSKPDPGLTAEKRGESGQTPKSAMLNANVDTSASGLTGETKPTLAPSAIPSESILKTMEGLQESYMTDAMFYTWKAGDTFPNLAQRFYSDPSRLATLKRLNEGRTEVQPGERVLIPIYDLDATQPSALAAAPAIGKTGVETGDKTGLGTARKVEAPVKPEVLPQAAPTSASGPRYHLVKDGENLWKIAKQELGSGSRWNEIYSANRDVLSSPEALRTGQKLRVP